jgi:hypothetical protein
MHMADALLSPAIGGIMWTATAATTVYSARKVQSQLDNKKIPLMGVLGAFVFAAQMINFAIPGTGSSGLWEEDYSWPSYLVLMLLFLHYPLSSLSRLSFLQTVVS